MTKVGIVGGGAAGLFAGCFLKREGIPFEILEKGDTVGRKLLLTGGGRCNISNNKVPAALKAGYHEASNFIYRAISTFTPQDAADFIENELKVPLKEEENGRMFPKADRASAIVGALKDYIGSANITSGFECTQIIPVENGYRAISSKGEEREYKSIIMCTGGAGFPATGSDGTAFAIPARLGHTVNELIPALAGVTVREKDRAFTSSLSGVSVNAGASLYYDQKKRAQEQGEVLFTHKGLSGPAIRELSREIPRNIESLDGWIELDFTPGRNETEIDSELLEEIRTRGNAKLTTLISRYVPSSVAAGIGQRAGVTDIYARDTDKTARKACVRELKHMQLQVEAPDFEDAYVTRGGISLKEIERDTMESKKHRGLYFIGEMVDVDGISGGYNLQAAISEAFIAVKGICGV